jgi:hypothetical protein
MPENGETKPKVIEPGAVLPPPGQNVPPPPLPGAVDAQGEQPRVIPAEPGDLPGAGAAPRQKFLTFERDSTGMIADRPHHGRWPR